LSSGETAKGEPSPRTPAIAEIHISAQGIKSQPPAELSSPGTGSLENGTGSWAVIHDWLGK
jgi:hypothetical protein